MDRWKAAVIVLLCIIGGGSIATAATNWMYGNRAETKIQELERRIKTLEAKQDACTELAKQATEYIKDH